MNNNAYHILATVQRLSKGSRTSAVLSDCDISCSPKAIHYSRPGKINEATKGAGYDLIQKRCLNLVSKTWMALVVRHLTRGILKQALVWRVLRRGQRWALVILDRSHLLPETQQYTSTQPLVRLQLVYSTTILMFELLKKKKKKDSEGQAW